ncbi:MAG: carbohydrate ABC transporter permease [Spirochaetota bacterium]
MSDQVKQDNILVRAQESKLGRVLFAVIVVVGLGFVFRWAFLFMRDSDASKLTIALVALTVGIGGIWALYASLTNLVEVTPIRIRDSLRPWVFVLPGVLILAMYIVFPAARTIWISFLDRTSTDFVGLRNYRFMFTDDRMLTILRNTLMWVVLVPTIAVSLGLVIAVMADRLSGFWEKTAKSFVFLPMAISFVGASVIWRFVYAYRPLGRPQIGLLNAIVTAFGADPVAWITVRPWNNLFLLVIMIWLQTGFAMVILSAAVKGVPRDLLDAARIDGCNEIRVFFNVIIPYVSGTILTVTTTILFLVLKIFDIVWVMTSGDFDTGIVASRMYEEAFVFRNYGRGSALAVLLFLVVIPLMIRNIKNMREKRR